MAATTETPYDIIVFALRILTIIDEISAPTIEQASLALEVLNDMMLNYARDGVRLGWYPQSMATYQVYPAPIQDYDTRDVKILLAKELTIHFGIEATDTLIGLADASFKALAKRYLKYVESDMTGLPFSQGGLFGPGRI
jgi:hypothetical protein